MQPITASPASIVNDAVNFPWPECVIVRVRSHHSTPTHLMFSNAANRCVSRIKPTRPVWFGSRLFAHSERTTTRIAK